MGRRKRPGFYTQQRWKAEENGEFNREELVQNSRQYRGRSKSFDVAAVRQEDCVSRAAWGALKVPGFRGVSPKPVDLPSPPCAGSYAPQGLFYF